MFAVLSAELDEDNNILNHDSSSKAAGWCSGGGSGGGFSKRQATCTEPYSSGRSAYGMQYRDNIKDLAGFSGGSGSRQHQQNPATNLDPEYHVQTTSGRAHAAVFNHVDSPIVMKEPLGHSGGLFHSSGPAGRAGCSGGSGGRRAAAALRQSSGSGRSKHHAAGSGGGFRAVEALQEDLAVNNSSAWETDLALELHIAAGAHAMNREPRMLPTSSTHHRWSTATSLCSSPQVQYTFDELLEPCIADSGCKSLKNDAVHCSYRHAAEQRTKFEDDAFGDGLQFSPLFDSGQRQSNNQQQVLKQAADYDLPTDRLYSQPSLHHQQQQFRHAYDMPDRQRGSMALQETPPELLNSTSQQYQLSLDVLSAMGHKLPAATPEQLAFQSEYAGTGAVTGKDMTPADISEENWQQGELCIISSRQHRAQQNMLLDSVSPLLDRRNAMHSISLTDSWQLGAHESSAGTSIEACPDDLHQQQPQQEAADGFSSPVTLDRHASGAAHSLHMFAASPDLQWQAGLHRNTACVFAQSSSPSFDGYFNARQKLVQSPLAELPQPKAVNQATTLPVAVVAAASGHMHFDLELLVAAEPSGMHGFSPWRIHAAVTAAAPAESEETVQQCRAQQELAESKLQAPTAAPAVAAREPVISECVQHRPNVTATGHKQGQPGLSESAGAEVEAGTPNRKQPVPLMLPFCNRLLHSAPPIARTTRVFARSADFSRMTDSAIDSMDATDARAHRADSNPVGRKLVLQGATAGSDDGVAADTEKQGVSAVSLAYISCHGTVVAAQAPAGSDHMHTRTQSRKRRHTCPAMVSNEPIQQQQVKEEFDSVMQESPPQKTSKQAAADHAKHAKQRTREQQWQIPSGRKPLADVTNHAASAQQQQSLQLGNTAGEISHQLKHLKQSKLPFMTTSGDKAAKPKEVQPEEPWWKKKQQQKAAANGLHSTQRNEADSNSKGEASGRMPLAEQQAGGPQAAAVTASCTLQKPSALKRSSSVVQQTADADHTIGQGSRVPAAVPGTAATRKRVRFTGLPVSQDREVLHQQQQAGEALLEQQQGVEAAIRSVDIPANKDCSTAEEGETIQSKAAESAGVAGVHFKNNSMSNSSSMGALTTRAVSASILSVEELERSAKGAYHLVPDSVTRHQLQQAQTLSQVCTGSPSALPQKCCLRSGSCLVKSLDNELVLLVSRIHAGLDLRCLGLWVDHTHSYHQQEWIRSRSVCVNWHM